MLKEFISFEIKEVDEMVKKLSDIEFKGDDIYDVIRVASTPMVDAIRNSIPIHTGNLRRSIDFIERSRRKGKFKNAATVIIGARTYGGFKGLHASVLEKGTNERKMTRGLRAGDITQKTMEHYKGPWFFKPFKGKSTGKIEGRLFMAKGFDATINQVWNNSKDGLLKLANKELKAKGLPTFTN